MEVSIVKTGPNRQYLRENTLFEIKIVKSADPCSLYMQLLEMKMRKWGKLAEIVYVAPLREGCC